MSAVLLGMICLIIFLPVVTLAGIALRAPMNVWGELLTVHLPPYLKNTILLVVGGGLLCLLWGTSTAWLVANFDFPLRKTLRWLLLLPLACPVYISGFIYSDLLGGFLPGVHSIPAAIFLFGAGLYPYVYVFTRAAFMEQSLDYQWAAQTLGLSRLQILGRVSLPMALPFISFGLLLATIEIINDFGLVNHYAINTISLGIYRVWLGMGNFSGAVILSLFMLFLLGIMMLCEGYLLTKRKRFENQSRHKHFSLQQLGMAQAIAAIIWCTVPVLLGFAIPCLALIYYAITTHDIIPNLVAPLWNTLSLVAMAIFLCIACALVVNYTARNVNRTLRFFAQSINLCYALPGTLLGLACIAFFGIINNQLADYASISGIVILLFAYIVRFTPPANRAIHNNLEKITPSVELAARGFAVTRFEMFRKIHLPLLKAAILSSSVIIFAELLKELPLVLILRPFNFETLATFTYQYATDERLGAASFPALLLIISGLPILYLLNILVGNARKELTI